MEGTLFTGPDYPHSNQGGKNHPMDPSHPSKERRSQIEESTGLQQPTQTDPEEGIFALVTNWKLTSQHMVEAWGIN
jgi:hypothetical protein